VDSSTDVRRHLPDQAEVRPGTVIYKVVYEDGESDWLEPLPNKTVRVCVGEHDDEVGDWAEDDAFRAWVRARQ
jgi:hypothetical protein